MYECCYPDCEKCQFDDCTVESKDIAALLKRRRYHKNPELHRAKQNEYRQKVKANLPHCEECDMCVLVKNCKNNGYSRICAEHMQLIEQKVSNSPHWCVKRGETQ